MNEQSKRGGKRNGAGRPVTVNASERITVTLSPADIALLKSISPNLSHAIRILIDRQRQR